MKQKTLLQKQGLIPASKLTEIIPLSFRHISDRVSHAPDFPRPFRAGKGGRRLWKRAEVEAWWESKKQ